ncbi:unnamed protein product [Somion occarium]|uniref:S-adenosyl-L-methionine-dependent methyltransferase n=1 Tax=Somion occarium TaxID=3059160 RepID=A0ABP1DM51_9APHY
MESTFSELDNLVSLITSSADQIKQEYRNSRQTIPSLNSTEGHPFDAEAISQELQDALRTVHGACAQLTAMVAPPQYTLTVLSLGHYFAACLNVAVNAKLADHLQSHPDGLHVSKLATLTKIDENKLARVLRLLATKHCFREVTLDVFANNRLSIGLLSDQPIGTMVGFMTDDNYRAGTALSDTLSDATLTSSLSPNEAAWARAMNYQGSVWDWYKEVDPVKGKRSGQAMVGFGSVLKLDSIVNGFTWRSQPEGMTVCDIGGGVGHVSMHIIKACPQLRVVLQDLPATIEEAKRFWKESVPTLVTDGRVEFVPLDFLKGSPVAGCDFYFIKNVLHDWQDSDCVTIITNIRKAMKPTSRLIIHEFLIQHVSSDNSDNGRFVKKAPEPLLPNYGEGRILEYYSDIAALVNAKERTLQGFSTLGQQCGLELVKVWECGQMNSLEFKLIDAV